MNDNHQDSLNRPKRPRDANQLAKSIADVVTGDSLTDPRPMTGEQRREAIEDLAAIARGEEAESSNLPWRRLRVLLDHGLVEITFPAMTPGSIRSINLTQKGLHFMDKEYLDFSNAPVDKSAIMRSMRRNPAGFILPDDAPASLEQMLTGMGFSVRRKAN